MSALRWLWRGVADSLTVIVGATLISFIQHFRLDGAPATADPSLRSP